MPTRHARLSPSSAERWINCPGSVRLSEQCEPDTGSSYAEEGTRAHALAEAFLRWTIEEIGREDYLETLEKIAPDGEMLEAVQFYGDTVMQLLQEAGRDAELAVEQELQLGQWVPDGFGTSDAVILGDDLIHVIDFKYGKGIRVESEGNPQIRLYALGAWDKFSTLYDFKTVRMTIAQPRLDHVSTAEMSVKDLRVWGSTVVETAAHQTLEEDAKLSCGDWCRFCPAKILCRARAEANLELARMDFKEPDLLTDDEIGTVLQTAEQLRSWVKDVEGYALDEAVKGKHFSGWKLVRGRSNRKYADTDKVAEKLKGEGFTDEQIYSAPELLGITAMEKLVGKTKLSKLLGELLVKPEGKPTLVPESDKRPEYSSAKEDFKNE